MKTTHIKRLLGTAAFLACVISTACAQPSTPQKGTTQRIDYSVQRIWSNGEYCSFTSLEKFKGRYYCAFREGRGHVFDEHGQAEGKIRIISSKNGKKWRSEALLGEPGMDYRDPKLYVTPDGRLMLSIGVSVYRNKELQTQYPKTSYSIDGHTFTTPKKCVVEGQNEHRTDWIWRTTWHKGVGYAVNYYTLQDKKDRLCLMTTTDGMNYKILAELDVPDFPNEATIRFLSDDRMALMVRRDAGNCLGYWAVSPAPYTEWNWKQMPMRLGGPDFLMLDNQRVVTSSRCLHIPGWSTTAIYMGNADTGRFHQSLVLPSYGDTSYGGMLIEGKELWVSYYACHETKWPSIYLAKIPLRSLW